MNGPASFQKFAGACGVLAGIAGLLYLALFILLKNPSALLPSLALLAVGVLAAAVNVALYLRLRAVDEGFALWGLLLGAAGAGGAAVHAAFDVATNLQPPSTALELPSAVDPRGFLTFAIAGLAAIVFSWLIVRSGLLPRTLGYLGILAGIVLILLYVAYLVILNATNPAVVLLVLAAAILHAVWSLWPGVVVVRAPPPAGASTPAEWATTS